METITVNAEKLRALDFSGDDISRIEEEADCYGLGFYKQKADEFMNELCPNTSPDKIIAELGRKFYLLGYMTAVEEYADEVAEILTSEVEEYLSGSEKGE